MQCCPGTRAFLSIGGTLVAFALVGGYLVYQNPGTTSAVEPEKTPPPAAAARDWPLWGGSIGRNLVNTIDRNIPDDWETKPDKLKNVLWSVDLGSKAYGGPIIAGGKVFIGTNNGNPRDPAIKGDKGVMMCFEERTGKFLWQLVFDKLPTGQVQDWPEEGICSAPVVQGDRLYFVSNRCEVVCANVADGKVVWKLDMIGELNVFPHNLATCSPLIVDNMLFLVTSNGVDEGHINIPQPAAPSFLAIDISKKDEKGKVVWSDNRPSIKLKEAREKNPTITLKELVDQGLVLMHGQWSNPVYAEPVPGKPQIIFPGGDGWLYSYNPKTGELLWKFDCNPKAAVYALGSKGTRNDFVCTPVVHDGKLYIGVGQDPEHKKGVGHLWCIDITKTPKGADKDLSAFSDPKDPNPKFDPKDPKNKDSGLVWHFGGLAPAGSDRPYVFGRTLSTCSVHDGLVYAGEFAGIVHCLDAKTGQQYWEHDMGFDTWASPYYVDGKVLMGNESGEVVIFKAAKEKELVNTVQMAGSSPNVRATPIVANGVLYVLSENPCKLYAIQKK
jgi:outer membrane protein assembly factor BamB